MSSYLKVVEKETHAFHLCRLSYGLTGYINLKSKYHLCAMGIENYADTCKGDSGGPLMCLSNKNIQNTGHHGRPINPNYYQNRGKYHQKRLKNLSKQHKTEVHLDCSYTLKGLTSFGNGCGRKNTPGVYVNIQNYHEYIMSVFEKYSIQSDQYCMGTKFPDLENSKRTLTLVHRNAFLKTNDQECFNYWDAKYQEIIDAEHNLGQHEGHSHLVKNVQIEIHLDHTHLQDIGTNNKNKNGMHDNMIESMIEAGTASEATTKNKTSNAGNTSGVKFKTEYVKYTPEDLIDLVQSTEQRTHEVNMQLMKTLNQYESKNLKNSATTITRKKQVGKIEKPIRFFTRKFGST